MSPKPRILAFAGSTRQDSYNKTMVRIAAKAAEQAGAEVNVIDLRNYPLPIFDEDLEKSGTPENARKPGSSRTSTQTTRKRSRQHSPSSAQKASSRALERFL